MRFSVVKFVSLASKIWTCIFLAAAITQTQQPASTQNPRLTIQYGHSNRINAAVFSPDGKLIASAGAEGVAILWDVLSRRELRRFTGHTGEISCIAFSPSGKYLITGGGRLVSRNAVVGSQTDFSVRLWDVATGIELKRFSGHRGPITSATFSPLNETTVLTTSEDGTVRIWNFSSGSKRLIWKGADPVNVARFSPDGKMIAIAGGEAVSMIATRRVSVRFAVRLVSVTTGRVVRTLNGHSNAVGGIVFSPDGKVLISTTLLPDSELGIGTTEARTWDVVSGRPIEKLDEFQGPAAFVASGQFLAIGCAKDYDYGICLLERNEKGLYLRDNVILIGMPAETDASENDYTRDGIVTVVESAGQRLLYVRSPISSGGSAGFVTGRSQMFVHDLTSSQAAALAGVSEPFRNFDAEWARSLNHFDRLRFANDNVTFRSGNTVWNTENSQVIQLSDLMQQADGSEPATDDTEESSDRPESSVLLSNTARYAALSDNVSVRLVEIATRKTIAELPGFEYARFTDDDARLMIQSGEKVYLFDTSNGTELFSTEITGPSRPPAGTSWIGFTPDNSDLTITPDGRYIFFQQQEKLSRVNIQTRETSDFDLPASTTPFIAVSPDSRYIAIEQEFVAIIDVETGAQLSVFKEFSKAPYGEGAFFRFHTLKISHDSKVALVAGDILPPEQVVKPEIPALKMMEITSGKEVWFANEQDPQAFAFSPDDNLFATVGRDQKTLTIRGRRIFEVVRTIAVADALIQQITFSPNSKLILVKTEDGATRVFNIKNGLEICRMLSLNSGNWITVKIDDGRFDTGDLDSIDGVHWIMSDRPFDPFPLEVFMRQYYEPGLLRRVLRCDDENNCDKEFKRLPSIAEINRVQPRLLIAGPR